jgi:hypothetical protein
MLAVDPEMLGKELEKVKSNFGFGEIVSKIVRAVYEPHVNLAVKSSPNCIANRARFVLR